MPLLSHPINLPARLDFFARSPIYVIAVIARTESETMSAHAIRARIPESDRECPFAEATYRAMPQRPIIALVFVLFSDAVA